MEPNNDMNALTAPVSLSSFLAPTGLGMTVVLVGLQLYLVCNHRSVYRPLLTARAKTG
jgi:hypothetical protein